MAEIKDLKRMCASYTGCLNCELYVNGCIKIYDLPDNADEIVDKWVKEHPVKTYMQDFFEKFPNAPKEKGGEPTTCIENIYGDVGVSQEECRKQSCAECWNQEMKENA